MPKATSHSKQQSRLEKQFQEESFLSNSTTTTFLHPHSQNSLLSSPAHPISCNFHSSSKHPASSIDLPALSMITANTSAASSCSGREKRPFPSSLISNCNPNNPSLLIASPCSSTSTNTNGACNFFPSERGTTMKSSMRNFSKMVCQKLEEVVITSYNEISDTLVQEFSLLDSRTDQKNIRRRVYDVLNVLNSMGIIEKDKRRIRWVGFPTEFDSCNEKWEAERDALQIRVQEKKKALQLYLQRYVALSKLIQRNKAYEFHLQSSTSNDLLCGMPVANLSGNFYEGGGGAMGNESSGTSCPSAATAGQDKLFLPFILISASKDCRIDCEMLEDRTQYFFEFDMPFTIHEDMEVLKLLNLDRVSKQDLFSILSPQIAKYYPEQLIVV